MTQDTIHRLLERYWRGETSLEEEQALARHFAAGPIPDAQKPYRPLFLWKSRQQALRRKPVRTPGRRLLRRYYYPALKVAASVLIVLLFGISVHTHYRQEKIREILFSSLPADAPRDSAEVTTRVTVQGLPATDSLRPAERPPVERQRK
jgi:hypothetical protein